MISETEIERAVDYLRDSAKPAAQARAEMKYLAEYLKSKIASLKLSQRDMSNAAAEDVAKSHPEYLELLNGFKEAVEKDAEFSFLREAADAKIRAWQTMCATMRAEGRAYS